MTQTVTPPVTGGKARPNLARRLPVLALGCAALVCLGGLFGAALLRANGILKIEFNLGNATPAAALNTTPTPTGALTPQPTGTASLGPAGATGVPFPSLEPSATLEVQPTAPGDATYLAWDANFTSGCDLFQGENEARQYGCVNGAYLMRHKQAVTRYTYYEASYGDAVIEAQGRWVSGTGKYEYGIVFRADQDGTLYYVFTVTDDGKYNVALFRDNQYTDLIAYTPSPTVNRGTVPNRFKVIARGSHLDFFLNEHSLGGVDEPTISRGYVGLFFYNGDPGAQVAFDKLTVSTFNRPTPAPPTTVALTPVSLITLTPVSNASATPGVSAPTPPAVAPGVYVTAVRLVPGAPRRSQPVTFFATFMNTTGRTQPSNWRVEIWENDPAKKNSLGIVDGQTQDIPSGTTQLATFDNWKLSGGGPCVPLRARVIHEDDRSGRIPFKRPNGSELWVSFQVCP